MKHMVQIQNNDLVVSIQDMADFSKTDYSSVRRLLRNNSKSFEELDLFLPKNVDFKSTLLNEPQATFLITLMENTDVVRRFRLKLVMEFYAMRQRLCEVNRVQLEIAQSEIKQLQVKRLKIYSHGFMSLRKYLKDNEIDLTEETAWGLLLSSGVVVQRDVIVSKKFLADDTFGKQIGDSVIEFNSRALDSVFADHVDTKPTLFN